MSELSMEDVINSIGNLTAPQLVALTKELEEKWGVKALPQLVQSQTLKQEVKESTQTEFNVFFNSFPPDKKMTLVKLVRELLNIGLLESKTLVESVPKMIKEGVSKEDADALVAKLTAAGAVMEIK